jgi:hypothetical protein
MSILGKKPATAAQQPKVKTEKTAAREEWLPFPNFILKTEYNAETAQLQAELQGKQNDLQQQVQKKLEQIRTIQEKGFEGKMMQQPTMPELSGRPWFSPAINTADDDERKMKQYAIAKEKYDREWAAIKAKEGETHRFIDQLRQEIGTLEKEAKSLQVVIEAVGYSKMRPKYSEQQQAVLLGVLMDGKQVKIQDHYSTDVRLICELFDQGLPVELSK